MRLIAIFVLCFAQTLSNLERPNFLKQRFRKAGMRFPSLFSHITEVNKIFELFSSSSQNTINVIGENISLIDFFKQYRDKLLIPCRDNRVFAHCQLHYLFSYRSNGKVFSSYSKTPCTL